MNMNKPPDETLKQGRNRSWLLVKLNTDSLLFNIRVECSVFVIAFGL